MQKANPKGGSARESLFNAIDEMARQEHESKLAGTLQGILEAICRLEALLEARKDRDPENDPDRLVTRSVARRYIPVSDVTFQRMEQRGTLVPVRFPGSNRPYYRFGDVLEAGRSCS